MLSEMDRVRRLAHTSFITLPSFAADLGAYRKELEGHGSAERARGASQKPSLKAVASVALAVATVSPTPPPRRPTPPTPPRATKGAAAEALATSKLFHKFLAAKKATKKKPAKKRKARRRRPRRGDAERSRRPQAQAGGGARRLRAAAAPAAARAAEAARGRVARPRPAPARAAKAPPKLPATPTTPPPPRITTDHRTKAQRWHAKHRNVAVLATTVVEPNVRAPRHGVGYTASTLGVRPARRADLARPVL